MNGLNQTQSNSSTITDNSLELTADFSIPTNEITSKLPLLPVSRNITKLNALISVEQQRQFVFLPQNFYLKKISKSLQKTNSLSTFKSPTNAER